MKKRVLAFILALAIIMGTVFSVNRGDVQAAGSMELEVNYTTNTITAYMNGSPIRVMLCSTGRATPRSGSYRLQGKSRWRQLFGGVCGQYASVITGNILFHSVPYTSYGDPSSLEYWEYDKLGTACSAGCVRLRVMDAKWIYENCPSGSTIVTFYGSSDPGPLGKPKANKISGASSSLRGWDPTDPASENPWNSSSYYGAAFDSEYYFKANPSLKSYGNIASVLRAHWLTEGMDEGLASAPDFDVKLYKKNYADLRDAYGDSYSKYVLHYNKYGKNEGRIAFTDLSRLLKVYSNDYYMNKYGDLRAAFGNDQNRYIKHYLNYGIKEGRKASYTFDVNAYKSNYADLQAAFGNDNQKYVDHYINYGEKENRVASITYNDAKSVFDANYYASNNADLRNAYGTNYSLLLNHYMKYGIKEGRAASGMFDVNIYKYNNADINNAYGNNNQACLEHYLKYGRKEGRNAGFKKEEVQLIFNAKYYSQKYPDLAQAYGTNYTKLLNHYINYGIKEGRRASATFDVNAYKKYNADLYKKYGNDNYSLIKHYLKYGRKEGRKCTP